MNSALEVFLIVSLIHPINILISIYQINNIIIQFVLCIIIPYLCIIHINLLKYILTASLILIIIKKRPKIIPNSEKDVDALRSCVINLVTIAIFACDFSNFPKRHLKTKEFGISLMDLGVGSFLFNNGMFVSLRRKKSILKSAFFLFLLGFVRLAVIILLNYSVDPTEYGYHFNFYFIMSIIYLLYLIIPKYHTIFSVITLSIHEYALSNGLQNFILSEKRTNFLEKNKEGISMILPSFAIFTFSNEIGKIINNKNKERSIYNSLILFFIFLYFYAFFSEKIEISRRLCNLTFVLWIVLFHFLQMIMFRVSGMYCQLPCKFVSFCGRRMLVIFLWSNLIVLGCNLFFDLGRMSYNESLGMNFCYLFLSFMVPYFFMN